MSAVSKAEYLRKYLSSNAEESESKKKKRKRPMCRPAISNNSKKGFQIVDCDAGVPLPVEADRPLVDEEEEVEEDGVAPVVVITDQSRADELKLIGKFKTDSWQSLEDEKEEEPGTSRRRRHDSDSSPDQSPVRKSGRHDSSSSSSNSPPRAKDSPDSDLSPVRPRPGNPGADPPSPKRKDDDDDFSPERQNDSDPSPPRNRPSESRQRNRPSESRQRRNATPEIIQSSETSKEHKKTLSGKTAGLQSAKQLRQESNQLKKKEQKVFESIEDSVSGRNAETVFRDRGTGKRRNIKEEQKLSQEQIRKQEELESKYKLWNKGVKQVESRKERLEEMAKEASKPLARYEGDQDLEQHLKDQEMKDDPMLQYMRKKKSKQATNAGIAQYPKYSGPPPPQNRFHIMPGYRWDGVDRSNGFEKKLFTTSNVKKAEEEEYYKWTTGTYE